VARHAGLDAVAAAVLVLGVLQAPRTCGSVDPRACSFDRLDELAAPIAPAAAADRPREAAEFRAELAVSSAAPHPGRLSSLDQDGIRKVRAMIAERTAPAAQSGVSHNDVFQKRSCGGGRSRAKVTTRERATPLAVNQKDDPTINAQLARPVSDTR
jgi:hypothetical protein